MNRHLREGVDEEEFVKMRKERDGGLDEPRLLHQSLQVSFILSCDVRRVTLILRLRLGYSKVNIRGGRIPRGKDGQPYLRIPVKSVPEGL